MSDVELARVEAAIEALVADHDPAVTDPIAFREARYDHGLAWVQYDQGVGGLSVRPELNRLVERRLQEAGAAPTDPTTFFMHLAGPTIATHGTLEQQQRFLRPMFSGSQRWCQLFSEPGAGSDLAGLGARAVRDGDEWVLNGQKVWNTLAHLADRGMLVARTDPSVPKHKGMTYFALDMNAPGVEVRPLRQITGEAEFNEVYLTDVRVPDSDRIGAEGEGWRAAITTLMNERTAIGGGGSGTSRTPRGGSANDAVKIWHGLDPAKRSAAVRDQVTQLWIRGEVLRLTGERAAEAARMGNPGPEGSIAKLSFTELNKALYSFCIELLGPAGQVGFDYTYKRTSDLDVSGRGRGPRYAFLRSRANSIEGGTSEIMRNILGEQVLGLPAEPRTDKARPWSEVPRN